MAFVGIDTQILIWGGIRGRPGDKNPDADLASRCRILFSLIESQKHSIVIPTICAAELAVPIEPKKRKEFLAVLSENFIVKPFDVQAAAIAAELYAEVLKLPKSQRYERRVLSADVKIIATAKAAGVKVFYSHDRKCRRIADLIMQGRDLPTHSEDLFTQ